MLHVLRSCSSYLDSTGGSQGIRGERDYSFQEKDKRKFGQQVMMQLMKTKCCAMQSEMS